MEKNDIIENTGHDAKGAKGFDYQFLYFIIPLKTFPLYNRLVSFESERKFLISS